MKLALGSWWLHLFILIHILSSALGDQVISSVIIISNLAPLQASVPAPFPSFSYQPLTLTVMSLFV